MGGDSPKEYRSPLKGHGKRRGSKVESRLFQRMPQRTRQKHQRRLLRAVRAVPRTLALLVMCYALGLVIYFGKYRVPAASPRAGAPGGAEGGRGGDEQRAAAAVLRRAAPRSKFARWR